MRPRPQPRWVADAVIRSPASRTYQYVRSLQQRRGREQARAFVVEGNRAIADALAAGVEPQLLLLREGAESEVASWLPAGLVSLTVAAPLFARLSDTVTPQGILAVFPMTELPILPVDAPLMLILDRIRDPGNLGTLLRTAAGAAVTVVCLTPESVDPFNPKVVRAAMGAHFRVPLRWLDAGTAELIVDRCSLRAVAAAGAASTYDELDWTQPAAIVIGSETEGVSAQLRERSTVQVRIPLAPGVESLNAAVAGAILVFEAVRQRRRAAQRG